MNEQMLSAWRALMDAGTQCLSHEEYKAAEGHFAPVVLQQAHIKMNLNAREYGRFFCQSFCNIMLCIVVY